MAGKKEIKITLHAKKKRVPVPQKPPKIEKNKKVYDRDKEKDKQRKGQKRQDKRLLHSELFLI